MFFISEINEWGEVTYVPTMLGIIVLALAMAVLIGLGSFLGGLFIKKGNEQEKSVKRFSAKRIVFSAMAIALGTILSNIKLFSFPTGGSITPLSMFVICLPGIWFGTGAGIVTGVAYGVLQLIIDPYVLYPSQLIIDYILAFGALGLSGLFTRKNNGTILGYIVAILGRYVFAVLSGCIFFGAYAWEGWNPLAYSMAYNAIYIFSEAVITVIILFIPAVKKAVNTLTELARN